MDQTILDFFVKYRIDWLYLIAFWISYLGSNFIVSIVVLFSVIIFYVNKQIVKIFAMLLSVCGNFLTVTILKFWLDRDRPINEITIGLSPSFPSYHAAVAIALYGFLLYFAIRKKTYCLKKFVVVFLSFIIVLLGISRLYLGVHYFSDVLIGYVVGFIWFLLGIRTNNKIEKLENWTPKIR